MTNKRKGDILFNGNVDFDRAKEIAEAATKEMLKEIEEDKEKGLDIHDIDSIINFDIGYTPLGYTVIVKEIIENQKIGLIYLPDTSEMSRKAVVIETGHGIHAIKPGDVISYRELPDKSKNYDKYTSTRVFKGVKFKEISMDMVAGVYKSKQIVLDRLNNV